MHTSKTFIYERNSSTLNHYHPIQFNLIHTIAINNIMSKSSPAPPSPPPPSATAIINPQYCVPHEIDLIITKPVTFGGENNFTVTDINKNVVFTVIGPIAAMLMPKERFLRDARGNTVLRLRKAIGDDIWKAYRGESTEQRDLIFTRWLPPPFQLQATMAVFLANKNTTQVCDFKLRKQNSFGQSWLVCVGESDTVIAEIKHEVFTWFSRKKFMVKVYPNVDYAFIVALTVTLEYHLSHSDLAKFSG
ncbi:hypothetical protein PIB30_014911 [Stylosanthes scabra]|uniref:Uncharacterized protein n=1 Tax=Stylosanthes scabra TaxID=79078 RepID=A0ABU6U5W6_9FABA|nr:hypothetical protein [Stylosanthes scabra]